MLRKYYVSILVLILIVCCITLIKSSEIVSKKKTNTVLKSREIPLSKKEKENEKNNFLKNLYNLGSVDDLVKVGVQVMPGELRTSGVRGRSGNLVAGGVDEEIKVVTPGKCDPKPVCITNPLTSNISNNKQVAFPPCINIHRCDGCCIDNEKCVAIKTHDVKLAKVGLINLDDSGMHEFKESIVTVQNHTDCECKCKWQTDDDCKTVNANYIKHESDCKCVCPEQLMCGSFHEFDAESCSCVCKRATYGRMEQTCKQRGYSWNDQTCRCDTKSKN